MLECHTVWCCTSDVADCGCQYAQEASGTRPQKASERQAPHSNVIVAMHVFTSVDGRPTGKFSTAGWDGRVLLWQVVVAK
jgi:hypothetical protein